MAEATEKANWVSKNWIITVLILIVTGLMTVGVNDQMGRTRNNEVNIMQITDRLAKVEANQQRVLEQLQLNGEKLDRLIERGR